MVVLSSIHKSHTTKNLTFAPIWLPHCPACRWTISLIVLETTKVYKLQTLYEVWMHEHPSCLAGKKLPFLLPLLLPPPEPALRHRVIQKEIHKSNICYVQIWFIIFWFWYRSKEYTLKLWQVIYLKTKCHRCTGCISHEK